MSKVEVDVDDPSTGPEIKRGRVLRGDDFEFSDSSSESGSISETQRASTVRGDTVDGDADAFGADEILEP